MVIFLYEFWKKGKYTRGEKGDRFFIYLGQVPMNCPSSCRESVLPPSSISCNGIAYGRCSDLVQNGEFCFAALDDVLTALFFFH